MCMLLLRGEKDFEARSCLSDHKRLILTHILTSSIVLAQNAYIEALKKKGGQGRQEQDNYKKIVDSYTTISFSNLSQLMRLFENDSRFIRELIRLPQ